MRDGHFSHSLHSTQTSDTVETENYKMNFQYLSLFLQVQSSWNYLVKEDYLCSLIFFSTWCMFTEAVCVCYFYRFCFTISESKGIFLIFALCDDTGTEALHNRKLTCNICWTSGPFLNGSQSERDSCVLRRHCLLLSSRFSPSKFSSVTSSLSWWVRFQLAELTFLVTVCSSYRFRKSSKSQCWGRAAGGH